MKKEIAIIGAGGLGREICGLVQRENVFAGFFDDQPVTEDYMGTLEEISGGMGRELLIAIGDPRIKREIVDGLTGRELTFANIVSPLTNYSVEKLSSQGVIICDGVMITVDANIGSHVLINLNATVGHDVSIGDYCSIMPGANISGAVSIGEATLIGSGAVILQGIAIGKNCKIGAGAVVTRDVPDDTTVVGVPARRI